MRTESELGRRFEKMKTLIIFIATISVTLLTLADDDRPVSTNVFRTYQDCFRFMAGDRDDKIDDNQLFKLVAESSMDWFWLDSQIKRIVIVIKLDLLGETYSAIRGAQGNGDYYLFVPSTNGYHHVGTMWGNSYKHGTLNGKSRFIASAHMSAASAIETDYVWNGSKFEIASKALYRYNLEDGNKTKIKDYMKDVDKTEQSPAGDVLKAAPEE